MRPAEAGPWASGGSSASGACGGGERAVLQFPAQAMLAAKEELRSEAREQAQHIPTEAGAVRQDTGGHEERKGTARGDSDAEGPGPPPPPRSRGRQHGGGEGSRVLCRLVGETCS